jgi:GxxExxY protein
MIMTENEITYQVRGAIFKVYNELGPGLLESIYQAALKYELTKRGLTVATEVPVPVIYDGVKLDVDYRLDLLVEGQVIIELKSVEELKKVYYKQLITYLKITNLKLGILVNFNTDDIMNSIKRIANNL